MAVLLGPNEIVPVPSAFSMSSILLKAFMFIDCMLFEDIPDLMSIRSSVKTVNGIFPLPGVQYKSSENEI